MSTRPEYVCDLCEAQRQENLATIRQLKAEGVPDDVLAPAALKAMMKPTHNTADHPAGGSREIVRLPNE